MIIQAVFDLLFMVVYAICGFIPVADWTIPSGVVSTISSIIHTCCYFLPMDTVIAILGIVIWFNIFRVVVSFIKTLWQIIPFL